MTKLFTLFTGLALSAVLAVGCSTTERAALLGLTTSAGILAINAKNADQLLQSGEVERVVLSVDYSEAEQETLAQAFAEYEDARERLKGLLESPEQIAYATDTVRSIYVQTVEAYAATQLVVSTGWERYTPAQQVILESWETRMANLDDEYQGLVFRLQTEINKDARRQLGMEIFRITVQVLAPRLGI